MLGHLLEDQLDDFFTELEKHRPAKTSEEESKDAVSVAYRYFDKRRHLLRFKECIDRGLPIASGMIEGGVRFIGKDRLDRSGTKWTVNGAEAILQLRCLDASKRWDAFFKTAATERLQQYSVKRSRWLSAA